jgi:hypothetical protein
MKRAWLARAVLALALLALALPVSAFEWLGRVGVQYDQEDTTTPLGTASMPHLDIDLGLQLAGFVSRPDLLTYDGSVQYRRMTDRRPGEAQTVRDGINYQLRTNLFTMLAPISASVHAGRENDQTTSGASGARSLHVDSQSVGGEVAYHENGRPGLGVGYTRSELVTRVAGLPDTRRDLQFLTGSTSYAGPGFSLSTRYLGTLSSGTYEADRYDEHRVDANIAANITDRADARIDDSYYLRIPTALSPFNPRQELNSLVAVVTDHLGPLDLHQGVYNYVHALQSAPGSQDVERAAHRVGYLYQRTLNPEWRLRTSVDGTFSTDRVGNAQNENAGQSLGLTAYWQRVWPSWGQLNLYFGPTVGVVEPQHASAEVGYGGTAGATVARNLPAMDLQASYDVMWNSDVGQVGSTFRQQARGSAQAPYGLVLVRGQLTLLSERHDVRGVGAGGLRTVSGIGSVSFGRFTGAVDANFTDGVSNPVANPGTSDGLFLSLPYNAHSYSFGATGSVTLLRSLSLSASGRHLSTYSPDRPELTESEARGLLVYSVGALRFQVEDRYTWTTTGGQFTRTNLFFVSAYRLFGSRY